MKKIFLSCALLASAGVFLVANSSQALPILTLTDGTNTITIDDTTDPYGIDGDGVVGYFGSLGSNTVQIFGAGSSYPANGADDSPYMHLGGGVLTGNGEITFTLTDTFSTLDPNIGSWITEFGGAGNGIVSFVATLNDTIIAQFDDYGPAQISTYIPSAPSYTFVLTATIQGASTSFDADFRAVPEPATMLLFGTGLAGLAGLVRRKKN